MGYIRVYCLSGWLIISVCYLRLGSLRVGYIRVPVGCLSGWHIISECYLRLGCLRVACLSGWLIISVCYLRLRCLRVGCLSGWLILSQARVSQSGVVFLDGLSYLYVISD